MPSSDFDGVDQLSTRLLKRLHRPIIRRCIWILMMVPLAASSRGAGAAGVKYFVLGSWAHLSRTRLFSDERVLVPRVCGLHILQEQQFERRVEQSKWVSRGKKQQQRRWKEQLQPV